MVVVSFVVVGGNACIMLVAGFVVFWIGHLLMGECVSDQLSGGVCMYVCMYV